MVFITVVMGVVVVAVMMTVVMAVWVAVVVAVGKFFVDVIQNFARGHISQITCLVAFDDHHRIVLRGIGGGEFGERRVAVARPVGVEVDGVGKGEGLDVGEGDDGAHIL